MTPAPPPARSLAHELVEGFFTLFVGAILQAGRAIKLVFQKIGRASARKQLRARAVQMGREMSVAKIGNDLILQRLGSTPAGTPQHEAVLEELGTSGLETGVPLLGLEAEYAAGRSAFEDARAAEHRHDATAARIWPASAVGWFALLVSYGVTAFGLFLLFAYLSPSSVPDRVAGWVGKGPKPAPAVEPEPTPTPPAVPRPEISAGDLLVTLKRAAITRGERERKGNVEVVTDELSLIYTVTITNKGDAPVRYESWRGKFNATQDTAARTVTSQGTNLSRYVFQNDRPPPGGVGTVTIEPGRSVEDVLHFGTPEPKFTSLQLYLPRENINRTGDPYVMLIPAAAVEMPDSFK